MGRFKQLLCHIVTFVIMSFNLSWWRPLSEKKEEALLFSPLLPGVWSCCLPTAQWGASHLHWEPVQLALNLRKCLLPSWFSFLSFSSGLIFRWFVRFSHLIEGSSAYQNGKRNEEDVLGKGLCLVSKESGSAVASNSTLHNVYVDIVKLYFRCRIRDLWECCHAEF